MESMPKKVISKILQAVQGSVSKERSMTFKEFLKRLIEKHIVAEFPWDDRCFDCYSDTCEGCEVRRNP